MSPPYDSNIHNSNRFGTCTIFPNLDHLKALKNPQLFKMFLILVKLGVQLNLKYPSVLKKNREIKVQNVLMAADFIQKNLCWISFIIRLGIAKAMEASFFK